MHVLALATALLLTPSTYASSDGHPSPHAGIGSTSLPGNGGDEPESALSSGPVAFAEQLSDFQALGIRLNPAVEPADVSALWGEDAYVQNPYAMLYISLGSPIEHAPFTPISDQAWYFDRQAIYYPGDYARVLENLERVTGGALDFEEVRDEVELSSERAAIAFTHGGVAHALDLVYYESYADPALLTYLVDLADASGAKRRLTGYSDGGAGLVIGWMSPAEREAVVAATGLAVDWLE